MNIYANIVNTELLEIIEDYNELNRRLHLDSEDTVRLKFSNRKDLIKALVDCRYVMRRALALHTYLVEGEVNYANYEHTKDLYKRSQIKVAYAIIYHDLKNVFEIIDIADSEKSEYINVNNVSEQDIENIYVATISFVLQTMKVFGDKFGIGGARKRGRPATRRTASEEA